MRTLRWGWLVLVALLVAGCTQVDPGQRAVFAYFGKVDDRCYEEGFYWYNPIWYTAYSVDAKVQSYTVKKAAAASKDLQDVTADLVVNFQIDGKKCHELVREVGVDFKERIVSPAVHEVLKAATAHFSIEKVIQDRTTLKQEILAGLRTWLGPYNITVREVALTNFDFSPEFTKAIERKQIEEQNVQRAEFLRQQAVKDAERQVALAKGQAESNRLIRESLTRELIQFEAQKKWDGKLPQVTGGALPFIDVGALGGSAR